MSPVTSLSMYSEVPSVCIPAAQRHRDPPDRSSRFRQFQKKNLEKDSKKAKKPCFWQRTNTADSTQVPSVDVFTAIRVHIFHVPGVHLLVAISACKKLPNLPKVCPPALLPMPRSSMYVILDLRHFSDHPPPGLAAKTCIFKSTQKCLS